MLACVSWERMGIHPAIPPMVVSDSVIALFAFGLGSILSATRWKNLTLLVRVSALVITMAKHYVQTHPDFKAKLSHEVQAELAKLHNEHIIIFDSPQSGDKAGGLG